MENKNLYLYVDSVGRKIKSANLTLNQYSTNNVFHLITVGKFDNVTATFRDPAGNLSVKYHLVLAGKYQLTEEDTEPLLIDNAQNLWEYILDPIAKRVTAIDVTATTARLSVSFSGFAYNQKTQILQEAMVASTTIVVNRADQSEQYDEGYNAEDVKNLWTVLNERIATGSADEERLEALEEEVDTYSGAISSLNNEIININTNVIPGLQTSVAGKVSKSGDTMTGNLGLLSASMVQGGMIITSESLANPEVVFKNSQGTHKFVLSGSGDGVYPGTSNTENLGKAGNLWKDAYIAGQITNGVKNITVAQIVDTTTAQSISGTKTFTSVPKLAIDRTITGNNDIVDAKYVADSVSGLSSSIGSLGTRVDTIEGIIPSEASTSNKLADKAFVNSTVNSQAAFFKGNFATQLVLLSQPWQSSNPSAAYYVSNNDYAYVTEVVHGDPVGEWDPDDHLGEAWRFIYVTGTGWQAQFMVNETPFTQAQLDAINSGITATILAGLAEKSELPTATSDLTNDSGYITDANVVFDNTTSTISGQKTFTGGVVIGNVNNGWKLSQDGSGFLKLDAGSTGILKVGSDLIWPVTANSIDLGGSSNTFKDIYLAGSIKNASLTFTLPSSTGTLALTSQIPTKTSQLTNDSSLAYISDLPTKTSNLTNDSGYITSSALPTKVSDLTNDTGFITSSALTGYALSSEVPGKTSDLQNDSGFITSSSLPTKVSDLQNDTGFITSSALSGYVESSSLATVATTGAYSDLSGKPTIPADTGDLTNNAGFITSSALNGYATESYVNNAIAGIGTVFNLKGSVATVSDLPASGNTIGDVWYVEADHVGYIWIEVNDVPRWEQLGETIDLSGYAQTADLATVATTGDYNDLTNKPTIPTVSYPVTDVTVGGTSVMSGTTAQIPALFSGSYNDLTDKPTIPTNTNQLTNGAGFITNADLAPYALSSSVPTDTGDLTNNAGFITISSVPTDNNQLANGAGYITSAALSPYALSSSVPTIPTSNTANKIVLTTTTSGTYKLSTDAIGAAAYRGVATEVTSGSTNLITSDAVATGLAAKQDASTAYNTSNIVYGSTAPSNPTTGMIWLKPIA